MKRSKKIWLAVAVSFVIVGAVLFAVGLAALDFDFTRLSTLNFETNTYEINGDFENIHIDVTVADVDFVLSEDGGRKVVCQETDKLKHTVEVQNGTLSIETSDLRKWYDHIGVFFGNMKITVYLPASEYKSLYAETNTGDIEIPKGLTFEDVKTESNTGDMYCYASIHGRFEVSTETGDVNAEAISVGELMLEVDTGEIGVRDVNATGSIKIETDTGDVSLTNVICQSLEVESDTGDIVLENVIGEQTFTIKSSTGDVIFDHSDAESIFVETNTGDVEGTLLSEKVFFTDTSTGDVDVPKTITGGRCEIVTSTGDIEIEIK